MEGERTTREAIEAFMQSELADTVVRRGSEMTFALQVDTWIRTLNFEEWEAYPTYLQEELSIFLQDEINAGRLYGVSDLPDAGRQGERYDVLWAVIYDMGLEAMVARQAEVYRDQPIRAAIEGFLASEVGREIVTPGSASEFQAAMTAWMHRLDVDRMEGPLFQEYLDEVLGDFIDTEVNTGHLGPPEDLYAVGPIGSVWDALQHITEAGLEARYSLEVQQGHREDMRDPPPPDPWIPKVAWTLDTTESIAALGVRGDETEHAASASPAPAPSSLSERVQAFVQAVKDVVRGREVEAPTQEHGAER